MALKPNHQEKRPSKWTPKLPIQKRGPKWMVLKPNPLGKEALKLKRIHLETRPYIKRALKLFRSETLNIKQVRSSTTESSCDRPTAIHPMDGALVGVGLLWPPTPLNLGPKCANFSNVHYCCQIMHPVCLWACFDPLTPSFQWYLQSKEILLNLSTKCWNVIICIII